MRPNNSVRVDKLKHHQWFRAYSSDGMNLFPQLFRVTGSNCFSITCEYIEGENFKTHALSHDWPVLPINVKFTLMVEEMT